MARPAILSVRIIGDAAGAVKSFDQVDKSAGGMSKAMDKASIAAAGVLGGLTAAAVKLEGVGEAANTANARVEHITKQMGLMGDEADAVSARVLKSAEDMARATGIDPNIIKQGQATLMTFENIARTADEVGGAFDRATTLSTDLAAAGFGSVESASVMLGKALNDPATGITALTRVGIAFTDQQKEQIAAMQEAGEVGKAQEAILAAIEKQVGGTALATADASDQMKVGWQLAQEEIALKLLPTFEKMREMGMQMAEWVADNSDLVLALAAGIGTLAAGVLVINGAMKAYAAIQAIQTAAQWASNAAWLASPITWIVLAVVAAIALVVAAVVLVVKHWDTIKAKAAEVWGAVIDWIMSVVEWLNLDDAWEALVAGFNWIKDVAAGVWDAIIGGIQSMIGWIETAIGWFTSLFGAQDTASANQADLNTASLAARAPVDVLHRMVPGGAMSLSHEATPELTARTATAPSLMRSGGFRPAAAVRPVVNEYNITITGAIDPEGTARTIDRVMTRHRRRNGQLAAAGETWQ